MDKMIKMISRRRIIFFLATLLALISLFQISKSVLRSEVVLESFDVSRGKYRRTSPVVKADGFNYNGPPLEAGRDYDTAARLAEIKGIDPNGGQNEEIPDGFVPIAISKSSIPSGNPEVRLCKLDFDMYSKQPSQTPLSKDIIAASPCKNAITRSLSALKKQKTFVTPTGFIFHESRVGSTLVANMLAADPDNLVYPENAVPPSVALHCTDCSEATKIDMLRILVNAMGNSKKHKRLFLKLQSANSPELTLYRKAFPTVPFVFLFRDPVETMMSQFKRADPGHRSPCLRSQSNPPKAIVDILREEDAKQVPPEKYCAAHLKYLCGSALNLAKDRNGMLLVNYDTVVDTFFSFVLPKYFKVEVSDSVVRRMKAEAQVYSKSRTAGSISWEADGETKRESASELVNKYAKEILQPTYDAMANIAAKQKRVADVNILWDNVPVSSRENQMFLDQATDDHLLHRQKWTMAMQKNRIVIPNEAKIKIYESYPETKPLKYFLDRWAPDDPDIPNIPGIAEGTLQRFDYMNLTQRAQAEHLRNHEVPFMLTNVPNIMEVKEKWSESYLEKMFGTNPRAVTFADTNHFPYFNKKLANRNADYKPPTGIVRKTFQEWLKFAKTMNKETNMNTPHWYFQVNGYGEDTWIANDLKVFQAQRPSFFIVDPKQNRGINCRFGMKGIIAETHYDGGRNFVAMLKGAKRYVLLPPSECTLTYLYPREHPEARHTKVDWSDFEFEDYPDMLKAQAVEVIVREGEVLYIPSYWFHYIVSTGISAQCNTRSGNALRGRHAIADCGFY